MDIVTIEQKLSDSKYSSLKEFVDDFNLIFDNCYEYNGADSGKCVCVYVSVCLSVCVSVCVYVSDRYTYRHVRMCM